MSADYANTFFVPGAPTRAYEVAAARKPLTAANTDDVARHIVATASRR